MTETTYITRRGELKTYFDRTAVAAWAALTSDVPVSGIRATVRAGRDQMRVALLQALPANLANATLLDAGCGTGALAVEAARRGAEVTAIDLSPTLVGLAAQRLPADVPAGAIVFSAGDMLDPPGSRFDHVVAMDSLIHYSAADIVAALARLAARTNTSIVFTVAPQTPALMAMLAVGRLFPKGDRSPAVVPVRADRLLALIHADPRLAGWTARVGERIDSGFYKSQSMILTRRAA